MVDHMFFHFERGAQARDHGRADQSCRGPCENPRPRIVEAYPIDMQSPKLAGQTFSSYSGYMGVSSAFRSLGFEEVGQASETQLIMRLTLKDARRRK